MHSRKETHSIKSSLTHHDKQSYLYRHGPQVRKEEEEPHELVGVDGDQVADLCDSQLAHRHVGRAQAHDLVVDLRL